MQQTPGRALPEFASAAGVDFVIAVWRRHVNKNKADSLFVILSLSPYTVTVVSDYCTEVLLTTQVYPVSLPHFELMVSSTI